MFHISTQSTRRVIPGRYVKNMEALETIMSTASRAGIKTLVYVVPIRDDVDMPHLRGEYRGFKQEVERLVAANGAVFANLENLVPAQLWGQKGSTAGGDGFELDFMHFQAVGHELLANELSRLFDEHFLRSSLSARR